MKTKTCADCKQEKEVSLFYTAKDKKSGYASHCKECTSRRRRALRDKRLLEGFDTPEQKHCYSCGETKSKDCFAIASYSADGLRSVCKTCDVEKATNYRKTEKGREYVKRKSKLYHGNEKNKKKIKAKQLIGSAVRRGDIIRPDNCSECDSSVRVEFHHDDYDKPLEVRALCKKCHMQWHKENGEGLNA